MKIRHRLRPSERATGVDDSEQDGQQDHIHQWSGGNTPKRCAWAWWRINISHSPEGPQYDAVCHASNLPASKGVSKFVHEHDCKKSKIFNHVPSKRRVAAAGSAEFINGHHEPRPMQKYIDSGKTEQSNRALTPRHLAEL